MDANTAPAWRAPGRALVGDDKVVVTVRAYDPRARTSRSQVAVLDGVGETVATTDTKGLIPMAMTPRSLIARSDDDWKLVALDRRTLAARTLDVSWSRPPAIARDVVYSSSGSGTTAIDEETGAVLWRFEEPSVADSELAAIDARLFGLTPDGNVFCLE